MKVRLHNELSFMLSSTFSQTIAVFFGCKIRMWYDLKIAILRKDKVVCAALCCFGTVGDWNENVSDCTRQAKETALRLTLVYMATKKKYIKITFIVTRATQFLEKMFSKFTSSRFLRRYQRTRAPGEPNKCHSLAPHQIR
jgi:hypothetical protein